MTYALYLDDQHDAGPNNLPYDVWVQTIHDMLRVIAAQGYPNRISLDHNLNTGLLTGMDALKRLIHMDRADNFIDAEFKMLMHSGHSGYRWEMCKVYDAYIAEKITEKGDKLDLAYIEYFV